MTTIHARATDQVLAATITPRVVSGNQNTVRLEVEFDASWNNYAKSAVFFTSEDAAPHEKPLSVGGACIVPPEVLAAECRLYIFIRGVNSGTAEIKATTPIRYKVNPGTPSLVVSDPAPDVYQNLLTAYGDAVKALDVERARIDAFLKLTEGSTTGDAELMDIRVSHIGETHSTAGEAVRAQGEMMLNGHTGKSPFNCLKIRRAYFYLGNTAIDTNAVESCKMRSAIVNLAAYKSAFATYGNASGSPNAVVGELNDPLPVSTDFSGYRLFINSDYAGNVSLRFSSGLSWSATETVTGLYFSVQKGMNIIPLEFSSVSDAGHEFFKYVSIQTTALVSASFFDAYIITDSLFVDHFKDEIEKLSRNMVYFDLPGNPSVYTKSLECTAEYNDSLVSIHIPEKTTDEAEWRFAIVSISLGKSIAGRKFLIRRNTNNMRSFGIGVSTSRWAEKNFPTDHDIHEIDVDEFIADNPTLSSHTGEFWLVIGIEAANSAAHTREYNESVNIMEISGASGSISPIARLGSFDPEKVELKADKYITCWGDSLTAGAGWTETLANLAGLPLYNGGTGGENARTITARQGADVMMINGVTIPAAVEPVTLATYAAPFKTAFGHNATPMLQGTSAHVNPVKIGDIEGTLKWAGSSYSDTSGYWTFTRTEAGEAVTINRPTAIRTEFDRNKNAPYLMVIFMGQNGGYDSDNAELVRLHRLMIEHANAKHTVILGLSSGSASSRAEYEAAMRKEFGRHFISLREYLSQYGLSDAGLTPTEADTAAMESGTVPPQLLADAVHYTSATKTVIGKLIYKRCCELGIF